MDITPVAFKYNTTAVSNEQFSQHMILYNGYITKVNNLTEDLESGLRNCVLLSGDAAYRGLKNGETYSLDGVILHEEYFRNMTSLHTKPGIAISRLLDAYFGGYNKFIEKFKKCAMSARGWCVLAYEQRTQTLRNLMLDTHDSGVVVMAYPIIVLDMYEHAYFLDYKTDKQKYIEAFINSIDWNVVDKRAEKIPLLIE